MKKLNNKGIMLLETLVVSTFIITVLVYLYVQFANLKHNYDTSFRYDTIPGLYGLKEVDKFINKTYGYSDLKEEVDENKYIELYKNGCNLIYFSDNYSYCDTLMENLNIKYLLLVSSDLLTIKNSLKENNKYSNGLYKYIRKLKYTVDDKKYILVAQYNDNSFSNIVIENTNENTNNND